MQQNFANFGLPYNTRQRSDTFKLCWEIWHAFRCNFHREYNSGSIV